MLFYKTSWMGQPKVIYKSFIFLLTSTRHFLDIKDTENIPPWHVSQNAWYGSLFQCFSIKPTKCPLKDEPWAFWLKHLKTKNLFGLLFVIGTVEVEWLKECSGHHGISNTIGAKGVWWVKEPKCNCFRFVHKENFAP